ncbi:MAG: DUF1566 domain-containing protein [Treponema sp.]|nr:DUF1566 domain-containing protein [Treponema sp.]
MKKLIILLLASAFVFAACSNGNNKTDEPEQPSGATTTSTTSGNGSGNSGGGTQTITYIGTKAPGEAKEVGDIVFNDGSAMSYSAYDALEDDVKNAKRISAIAVIFYKGTDNSDVLGEKTLGVGLKHDEKAWCTTDANAYNILIQSTVCYGGKTAGSLTFADSQDKDGSNNLSQIASWLTDPDKGNTTDDTTGEGASDRYPAFYFAKDYAREILDGEGESRLEASGLENGWYLPSLAELFQIWKNKETINTASGALGGDTFGAFYYWSSSQEKAHGANYAFVLGFSNGDGGYNNKYGPLHVCAIREFN